MKKAIIIIITIIILFSVYFLSSISTSISQEKNPVYFNIESGDTLKQISKNLVDQGFIKNRFVFETYTKLRGWQNKILAGSHLLNKSMSIREIIRSITTTANINNEKTITIIEGWRAEEIADYLDKNNITSKADFLSELDINNWRDQYEFLAKVKAKNIEGFLFPDTYRIFYDATPHDIVKKMLDTFDDKLTPKIRTDLASQGKNVFEVVTSL